MILQEIASTFLMATAAVAVVALLVRLGGGKPKLFRLAGLVAGITLATAIERWLGLDHQWHILLLTGAVAVCSMLFIAIEKRRSDAA